MAYLRNPAAGGMPENSSASASKAPTRYYGPFGSILFAKNGLVAVGPPWCELVAYDLNEGTIKWRVAVGTTPGLAAKGITNTGSSHLLRNAPVVTAGGLIFLASGPDRMVHAYDKDTGHLLWETEVAANPDGMPAVYEAGGRQFIAFFGTSDEGQDSIGFKAAKPGSQGYYVFALPTTETANRRSLFRER
jgi:quinoprotein glucose dehydrogenase